jgi:hypothetical protein
MAIDQSQSNNKKKDSPKLRLSLAQGLMETHFCCCSVQLPPRRLRTHFPEHIPATRKKAEDGRKCVVCTKHCKRENLYSNVFARFLHVFRPALFLVAS